MYRPGNLNTNWKQLEGKRGSFLERGLACAGASDSCNGARETAITPSPLPRCSRLTPDLHRSRTNYVQGANIQRKLYNIT